jgi:hypothetical protein
MRFVIKPAGIAAVLTALGGLAFLAFGPMSGKSKVTDAAREALPVYLNNADFERKYIEYRPQTNYKGKAKISGKIAEGWYDNSDWAELTVHYAEDQKSPHGGATCQRIEIGDVQKGNFQYAQTIAIQPGQQYHAIAWVRASEETEVELHLRRETGDYRVFAKGTLKAGKEWRPVELIGSAADKTVRFFLLTKKANVTLWVDDAKIEPVKMAKK